MSAFATVPRPDEAETRCNAGFEALMWALARPGSVQTLPAPGFATVAEVLLDRECRVFTADAALARFVVSLGSASVPVAQADHCFLSLADAGGLALLQQVSVGSALYPDAGATVLAQAEFGPGQTEGQRLRLRGPGIETATEIRLGGLAPGLWPLRAARCRYPAGFDLFLLCGAQVIGLPRSTQIEVV